MSDGDQVTADGLMQVGDIVIDAGGDRGDATTRGEEAITGLDNTAKRINDQDRTSGGSWAARRVPAARQVTLPWLATGTDTAVILAALEPEDLTTRRDLVWQGVGGWPSGHKYRLGVLPGDGTKAPYDRQAGVSDDFDGTAVFDANDPHVYAFDPTPATLDPGATTPFTLPGTHASNRTTFTFWGPWSGPGVYVQEFPTLGVCWPDLDLEAGEGIFVQCDPFNPAAGFGSFELDYWTLWGGAKAPLDTGHPYKHLPILLPGAQHLVTTGTGFGHVDVSSHAAFITPEVIEP